MCHGGGRRRLSGTRTLGLSLQRMLPPIVCKRGRRTGHESLTVPTGSLLASAACPNNRHNRLQGEDRHKSPTKAKGQERKRGVVGGACEAEKQQQHTQS